MIKMIFEDGVYAPKVFCDWCGKQIESARQGNYEWSDAEDDPEQGKVYFAHKRCSRALETAKSYTPGAWCTDELMFFPLFVGNNLNLDWDGAWKHLKDWADWGFAGPQP